MTKTQWVYLQRKTHCYLTPFIEVIGKVYSNSAKKVWFNKSFENYFVTYTNGVMTWYGKKDVIDDLYTSVSAKVIKDPAYLKKMYELFQPEIKKLMELSEKIHNTDHTVLKNEDLWTIYKTYVDLYNIATVYGEPVPLVTKDIVVQHIKRELDKFIKDKDVINELMTTLTTPLQSSFIRKEEEDMLKIAIEIKNGKKIEQLKQEIAEHTKKYCWLPYDYGVQVWDEKHFTATLNALLKEKDPEKELNKIQEEAGNREMKQNELKKKHNIPKPLQDLFEYVRLATYMMDYKKELFTKSHYLIIPLIDAIAERLNTNNVLVRFMNHEEIKSGLLENKPVPEKLLKQRFELSVCLWDKEGNTKFLEQDKVKQFIKDSIDDIPEEESKKKLHGMCACVGRYTGKARIILSAMHITEVQQGEVLIAPMTSPDYVVGMKKAGAIVTDEGGLTCHASIVSRELKIPCVVGTGKATKTFKTGDLVEVNANHASIKLIEATK